MDKYLKELAKYFPGELRARRPSRLGGRRHVRDRAATCGAGPDRTRLIADLNQLTSYTADGIVSPIDWRLEHNRNGLVDCNVYVRAIGGHYVPCSARPARPSRVSRRLSRQRPQRGRGAAGGLRARRVKELSRGSAIA